MLEAERLFKTLAASGLSLAWAADKLGVTRQAVQSWHSGRSEPHPNIRLKIRILTAGLQKLEQTLATVKNQ